MGIISSEDYHHWYWAFFFDTVNLQPIKKVAERNNFKYRQ